MLHFSVQSLKFRDNQANKIFYIHNDSAKIIAYTIKANNLEALEVIPNCGLIKQSSRVHVEVKRKKGKDRTQIKRINRIKSESDWSLNEKQETQLKNVIQYPQKTEKDQIKNIENISLKLLNLKIKVEWAQVDNIGETDTLKFVDIWAKLESVEKNSQIIRIKSEEESQQNFLQASNLKNKQKPYEMNISKVSPKKIVPDKNLENSLNIIEEIIKTEQQLNAQKKQGKKIRQKINITEEKLRQINQQRLQIKVNKSVGIQCDENHKSFSELLLTGLIFFLAGYLYQKWGQA